MKRKFTILIAAAVMLLTMISQPTRLWGQTRGTSQKTEGFENATTSTTYNSTKTINATGNSNYSDCGIGWSIYYGNAISTSAVINDDQSCLMRYYSSSPSNLGYANTTTGIKGLTNVTFNAKVTNTGNKMGVWYSTDQSNWTALATNVTLTTSSQSKSYDIPNSSATTTYYVKIGITSATTDKKDLIIDNVCFTYTTYTVSYAANGGSGTMTDSNSPYCVGDEVTLLSNSFTAPSASHSFNGWVVTDGSSNPVAVNNNKFTMPASNVTVTAQWLAAGNYITVSPTSATPTCKKQDIDFDIDTDQDLDDDPTVFYTTSAGTSSTTAPDWINEVLYYDGTLTVSIKQNKTSSDRTAYFRVENGDGSVKSNVITVTQAAFTLPAPSFDPESGALFINEDVVLLESDTTGVTFYYTMGENPATPTTSSSVYDPEEGIAVDESTTIKAIAVKYNISSAVATANYTVVNPLTTMDAIFTASATTNSYYVTLGNWVVSAVTSDTKTAYITDNAGKGFIAYYSSGSIGLAVGDVLSNTVQLSLKRYNGAAESTNLYSGTSGLGKTTGGTITPITNKTIADLSGVCTGGVYTLSGLTYNSSTKLLSDGVNTIKPYNQLYSGMSFENGETYTVTGVYLQYDDTKELLPRSSADIVVAPGVTASVTSISNFTYNVGGGPDVKSFKITGANLTDDVTVTASTNYKVCKTSDGTYTSSVSYEPTDGALAETTVYVRLESGLSSNTYEGTVTVASEGATSKEIALTGTVTHVIAYNTSLPTGCSVNSEPNGAQVAGQTVSVSATAGSGYKFSAWDVYKTDESSTKVTVTNNAFTMPSYNVTVSATFVEAYTVTYDANGGTGTMTDVNSPYTSGSTVTVLDNEFTRDGYVFTGWNTSDDGSGISYDPDDENNTFTITENTTLYAQWSAEQYNVALSSVANVDLLASYGISSTITEGNNADVYCGTKITLSATNMTAGKVFIWAITDDEDSDVTDDVLDGDVLTVPAYNITIGGQIAELFFKYSGDLTEGDYIIANGNSTYAMLNTINSNIRFNKQSISPSNNQIIVANASAYLWHIASSGDYWTIYNAAEEKYVVSTGTASQAILGGNSDDKCKFSVSGTTTYTFVSKYNSELSTPANAQLCDGGTYWACYKSGSNTLYKKAVGSKHSVACATGLSNGSVSASPSSAYEGQPVALTAAPDDGYMLDSWDVYKTGDATTKITVKNNSFVMPGYDVTVSATFRVQHTYTLVDGSTVTLVPGKHYIIASLYSANYYVMGAQNDNVRSCVTASLSGSKILEHTDFYEVVISGSGTVAEPYTIYSVRDEGYLYSTGASKANIGVRDDNVTTNPTYGQWTISISSGTATISSKAGTGYTDFQYNHNGGNNRFACYSTGGQTAVKLYVRDGDDDIAYYSPTAITVNNADADDTPITVLNNEILTLTGTTTCTDPANIVIEDGGQLIHTNAVNATLHKEVTGYGANPEVTTGWYTIASPVADLSASTVATTEAYDLFAYQESNFTWLNTQNHTLTFAEGQGFLYANSANQTLAYAGSMKATNAEVSIDLSYTAGAGALAGYNLVGNPFSRNLTSGEVKVGGSAITTYYVSEGGENLTPRAIADYPIKPGQGFFVQATDKNQQIVFNPSSKDYASNNKPTYITIEAGNSNFTDRAYVQLGGGNTLRKMSVNDNVHSLYVIQDGKDYASATIDSYNGSIPVCFKAKETGRYTINVETTGIDADYLHLIDRYTGADVDLLSEPSYTFIAAKDDYESRFTLVFTADGSDTNNDIFAYQSGSAIIVNGNGELQIFDVTGRRVMTTTINGMESINIPNQGVYIFKLNEKVQKIVVR